MRHRPFVAGLLVPVSLLAACGGGGGGGVQPPEPGTPQVGTVDELTIYSHLFDPRVFALPTEEVGTITVYATKDEQGLPLIPTAFTAVDPGGETRIDLTPEGRPLSARAPDGTQLFFDWDESTSSVTITGVQTTEPDPIEVTLDYDFGPPPPAAAAPPPAAVATDSRTGAAPAAALAPPLVEVAVIGCVEYSPSLPVAVEVYSADTLELLDRRPALFNPATGRYDTLIPVGPSMQDPVLTLSKSEETCTEFAIFLKDALCTDLAKLILLYKDLIDILKAFPDSTEVFKLINTAEQLTATYNALCMTLSPAEGPSSFDAIVAQFCDALFVDNVIVGGAVFRPVLDTSLGQVVGSTEAVETLNDFPVFLTLELIDVLAPFVEISPPQPGPLGYVARADFPCVPPGSLATLVVFDPATGWVAPPETGFFPEGAVDLELEVVATGFPSSSLHLVQASLLQPGETFPSLITEVPVVLTP